MHVADRDVAFVPQRVVRQRVAIETAPHVVVAPVRDRVQLPAAVVEFQELRVYATFRLAAADAGDPGAHAKLVQRTPHGLDLAQAVVVGDTLAALFPQRRSAVNPASQ